LSPIKKPILEIQFTLADLFDLYQAEQLKGVMESSTRLTETTHVAYFLRIIGSKTAVQAITTEPPQRYVNARAREKGRAGRCVSRVKVQKELGTLRAFGTAELTH
jgi:hypothetical protein